MAGLTFSYVIVNVLVLLAIKRQAKISEDSLAEFRKQATSSETQFERQLDVMKAQSIQAAKSADAAKASADALISIERARLLPDGFVNPMELPDPRMFPLHVETRTVRVINRGRTPAVVVEWLCTMLITESANVLSLLDYSQFHTSPNGQLIPPDGAENFFAEWSTNSPSEIRDVRAARKQLYIYGFVKYRDIFGNQLNETYFCFHYFRGADSEGLHEGWTVEPQEANRST